eukprot:CAMPEP_0115189250 /NCGR_PEP_ID=MMETSP0270-20121206/11422_1 /TAXON_ID=71861 /ORGANISM="Scrippsiella trochoidea, Strain CCMP3099" /LENGTH=110 /DNA_ID=CAMNT_0002602443 /DNA_START=81 /DNA_END=413 /DNA_ORIENTATION=+
MAFWRGFAVSVFIAIAWGMGFAVTQTESADATADLAEKCKAAGLVLCEMKGRCLQSDIERCPDMEEEIRLVREIEEAFEGGDYQTSFFAQDDEHGYLAEKSEETKLAFVV